MDGFETAAVTKAWGLYCESRLVIGRPQDGSVAGSLEGRKGWLCQSSGIETEIVCAETQSERRGLRYRAS